MEVHMGITELALANSDRVAVIDDDDYARASKLNWRLNRMGYVEASVDGTRVLLHRFVMRERKPEVFIDHKDGDRLDNRKGQLRRATAKQNGWNKGKPKVECSSQYKGVSFDAERGKWYSCIHYEGKTRRLGRFASQEEAAAAYDAAAKELFGKWARLNGVTVNVTVNVPAGTSVNVNVTVNEYDEEPY
jgi:hypothetical protein